MNRKLFQKMPGKVKDLKWYEQLKRTFSIFKTIFCSVFFLLLRYFFSVAIFEPLSPSHYFYFLLCEVHQYQTKLRISVFYACPFFKHIVVRASQRLHHYMLQVVPHNVARRLWFFTIGATSFHIIRIIFQGSRAPARLSKCEVVCASQIGLPRRELEHGA